MSSKGASKMEKIKIIHEPTKLEPFVIVDKQSGIPSAPLNKDEKDNVVYFVSQMYPEILNVQGRKSIEYGLFHRLDTQTSGLLLLCTEQYFYDYLIDIQSKNLFIKEYTAFCDEKQTSFYLDGFPPVNINKLKDLNENEFKVTSFFRKFGKNGKEVRPVTEFSGIAALKKCKSQKEYCTYINFSREKNCIVANCRISQGFRHQVRCHLSWIGYPVKGDLLYNFYEEKEEKSENLCFYATGLRFPLPDGNMFEAKKKPSDFIN